MQVTDQDDPQRRPIDGVRELRDIALTSDPGSAYHYSSANYLVLAAVVEEVTAATYADELSRAVLDPLGMTDVVTTSAAADERLPPGHRYVAGRSVGFDSPYDPAGLAYGYLGGTITDLARFAQAQLGGAPDVVAASDLTTMQARQVTTGSGGTYGLGWRQNELDDFGVDSSAPIVWHSGAAPGYQSAVILLPEQERAVVVLQNSFGYFQETALLDTSIGIAALIAGAQPAAEPTSGLAYPGVLLGLGAVVVGLSIMSVRAMVRIARQGAARTRRRVLMGLGASVVMCGGLAYLLGIYLPALAGMSPSQLSLWAPDVGWLAMAGAGLSVGLAVLRAAVALRDVQAPRTSR